MKKKNKIMIVVLVVIIAIIITLWGLKPPETKSLNQVMNNPDKYLGKNINLKGTVENNSIKNSTDSLLFCLTEGEYNLSVIYIGNIPNNFVEGKKVILKGVLKKDEDNKLLFIASKITVGCPSRYN